MKINQTPIRTCRNYNINNFEVPDNTFSAKATSPAMSSDATCKIEKNNLVQKFPLCKEAQQQSKHQGESFKFVFDKNSAKRTNIFVSPNKNNSQQISNIALIANQNIETNILISSKSNINAFINSFLSIECKPNSKLNITIINNTKKSQNFVNIQTKLHQNATCNLNIIDFCDTLTVLKQTAEIIEPSATFNINMLYLGTKHGAIDINIISNLFAQNSSTNINVIGALFDQATKNFKGTINFKNGAIKSIGIQTELCLLFSKDAKSKALPILLAAEEDVDGSHSSATSKIDDKQLFYLMSRGLNKLDSMKLYLKAKFNSITSKLDPDIQTQINKQIDRKLKKYEEL